MTPPDRSPPSFDPQAKRPERGYLPIEDHGVIGNMRTCALIGVDGTVDWLCLPNVDSPSVFGALLDTNKGGYFQIAPRDEGFSTKQMYFPDTNILITRFLSANGVGEVEDLMPAGGTTKATARDQLVRRIRVMRGEVTFRIQCHPAFDYARVDHETTLCQDGRVAIFTTPSLTLGFASPIPLTSTKRGVEAEITLGEGETAVFVLRPLDDGEHCLPAPTAGEAQELFEMTATFWRRWLSACSYKGRWREMVHRSALALKLLTFEPTGAIVAAPTTSLPEALGGARNWDYRYSWLRDAAFTVYGFLRVGFPEEAARFMDWIEARCRDADKEKLQLQIMYAVDGRRNLKEETLEHLEGYKGSRPVRIGNGAHDQLQLDVYGELLDSVYLYNKHVTPISYDLWQHLRRIVDWVDQNWQLDDDGIWEVRGSRQPFVYSKLMCWVALDRGLRLADKRSFPADRAKWLATRDAIYETIMTRGYSEKRQAYVQTLDGDQLDASNLLMPLVFFSSPTDPRMIKTIDAIKKLPRDGGLTSDGLVYRYRHEGLDGLQGDEGSFNMCSFWLVEALTRAAGTDRAKLDEARLLFERMLGYANHVGLYAEETGAGGEALGNFPQAFTHLALISAAYNLDKALSNAR